MEKFHIGFSMYEQKPKTEEEKNNNQNNTKTNNINNINNINNSINNTNKDINNNNSPIFINYFKIKKKKYLINYINFFIIRHKS